jgi:hypothetical protein
LAGSPEKEESEMTATKMTARQQQLLDAYTRALEELGDDIEAIFAAVASEFPDVNRHELAVVLRRASEDALREADALERYGRAKFGPRQA